MRTAALLRYQTMIAACLIFLPTMALAQTPTKDKTVRIGVGSRVINIIYPYLNMPLALGYWKSAGINVELIPMSGSVEAIQQIVAGGVDFAMLNSGTMMQANADNGLDLRGIMLVSATDWSLAVLSDSTIKEVRDFKGKIIGVPALSTGGMTLLKDYLISNGLTPDRDVSIVPVGFGGPAYEALRSDRVQGLMFFQTGITGFENLGARLRVMFSPDWRKMPDFTLATSQKMINRDPDLVTAVVQGAIKGQVFSMANPDCARRVQWKTWPETAPTGANKESLAKWDLNLLAAQRTSMINAFNLAGGKLYGLYTPEMADTLQQFLARNEVLKRKLPPQDYVITKEGFFEAANGFDPAPIKKQAEECSGF